MAYRRATLGVAIVFVGILSALPAAAIEDSLLRLRPPPPPTADAEFRIARFAARDRATLVITAMVEANERAIRRAAQARYDAAQRARVAAAVEHYSAPATTAPRQQQPQAGSSSGTTGRCGGDLPPCSVMERESGGNIRAENPSSSASGKWQFLDSTWNNYGGYDHAADAPESVQDARARELWAGGAGCSHWSQTAGDC